MKQNMLIKVAGALGLCVVLMVGFKAFTRTSHAEPEAGPEPMSQATQTALGIEADTPADTIRTLASSLKQQRLDLALIKTENDKLKLNEIAMREMAAELKASFEAEISQRLASLQENHQDSLAEERGQLKQLMASMSAREETVTKPPARSYAGATVDADGTVWVPPLGESGGKKSLLERVTEPLNQINPLREEQSAARPAYTIAKNSTLIGATAFTALVGRIPVGSNVVDPYLFKVIIGSENLIANGQRVPELQYAVFSGKARGDLTLSCVSGSVTSATFVFTDGRVKTLPRPVVITEGGTTTPDLEIGVLSDDLGHPCVPGKIISNFPKRFTQAGIAAGISAASAAAAASQTTTSVNGSGGVSGVTGSKSDFILNETISGVSDEFVEWIRERQALEFDAVYAKPGKTVAIHITEELRIDYEDDGRLVRYDNFQVTKQYRALD